MNFRYIHTFFNGVIFVNSPVFKILIYNETLYKNSKATEHTIAQNDPFFCPYKSNIQYSMNR